jgi:hypothetical protein
MIKKLIFPLLLFWGTTLIAQCPSTSITLASQADVNNFAIDYPDCAFVDGDVIVSGSDITDLSGLSGISSIGGQLIIENNDLLTTLSGWNEVALLGTMAKISIKNNPLLEDLTTFFGVLNEGLELIDLPVLNDIAGFNGVSSVGALEINGCDSLTNLVGLENAAITAQLRIEENNGLSDISNLNAIIGPLSLLQIGNNPALTSFSGLQGLNMLDTGSAFIFGNIAITDFDAFTGWTTAPSTLSIQSSLIATSLSGLANMSGPVQNLNLQLNNALTDLDGLQGITKVTQLTIGSNANLTSLDGLNGLSNTATEDCALFVSGNALLTNMSALNMIFPESVTNLAILGNTSLSDCYELLICGVVELGAAVITISGNADGCNSLPQVANICILGTNELEAIARVSLYPNPADQMLTISLPFPLTLKNVVIFDLAGNILIDSNSTSIPLGVLASGMYFVQIVTNQGSITKRVLKK